MSSEEQNWRRRELAVCARVNAAIVLEAWLRGAAGVTIAAAVAVLLARALGFSTALVFGIWLALLGCALGFAVVVRRKTFWRAGDGLLRLEIAGRLHGRLSTAAAGVGAWPGVGSGCDAALRWRLGRNAAPLGLSSLLLLAACWAPLDSLAPQARAAPTAQPMAWQQVESWIDQLRKADVAQPESLERVEQQLRSLQRQPPAQWYAHASLEAGASLKARTEQALRGLGRELARAKAAADAARRNGLSAAGAAKAAAAAGEQALSAAESAALPPSADIGDAMRSLAESGSLRPLDAGKLAGICDSLGRGIAGIEQCLGPGSCKLGSELGEEGNGGISRGPGEAPLTVGERSPPVGGNREALSSDLRNATLGDVVREQVSAPEIDGTAGTRASGGAAGSGQGGETIARQALVPAEEELLKRYFK